VGTELVWHRVDVAKGRLLYDKEHMFGCQGDCKEIDPGIGKMRKVDYLLDSEVSVIAEV
jgi:hypothetical protein